MTLYNNNNNSRKKRKGMTWPTRELFAKGEFSKFQRFEGYYGK